MLGYVSDDERPRSPGLQQVIVKYTPPHSPISFVPRRRPMTDSVSEAPQKSRKRGRNGRRVRPSQGDVVLLGHLDPNRPDIAAFAGTQTFAPSDSASDRGGPVGGDDDDEDDDDDDDDDENSGTEDDSDDGAGIDEDEQHPRHEAKMFKQTSSNINMQNADQLYIQAGRQSELSRRSSSHDTDIEMPDAPNEHKSPIDRGSFPHRNRNATYSASNLMSAKDEVLYYTSHQSPSEGTEDQDFAIEKKIHGSPTIKSPTSLRHISDSIASSPRLAPHIVNASQRSPREPDHLSRGRMAAPAPQEQSLPSIHHLVRVAETQDEVFRQQRPRTDSISSVSSVFTSNAPSHAAVIPPSAAHSSQLFASKNSTQSAFVTFSPLGRTATDPTPLPPLPVQPGIRHVSTNPADFAMHSTANSHHHPRLPSNPSVASTSTAGASPGSLEEAATPSDRSSTLPLPVSPTRSAHSLLSPRSIASAGAATVYKCQHPGCHAPPFQTPYLLNSHRNVHSSDRPYFCPRKDCPRSQPGKGFKRKNEMLRHGLVHESPGYVCPFCSPEKEHRYPRPDNLQRHVKMHHEDVDPEDSRLREVLGQRRTTIASSSSNGCTVAGTSSSNNLKNPGFSTIADAEVDAESRLSNAGVKSHPRLGSASENVDERRREALPQEGRRRKGNG